MSIVSKKGSTLQPEIWSGVLTSDAIFPEQQIAEARDMSLNIYDYHTIDCGPDFEAYVGNSTKELPI